MKQNVQKVLIFGSSLASILKVKMPYIQMFYMWWPILKACTECCLFLPAETGDVDDMPGLKVMVRELDDVLLRDVGNRIKESGK